MPTERPVILHVFPSLEIGGLQRRTAAVIEATSDAFEHRLWSLSGDMAAQALMPSAQAQSDAPALPKGATLSAVRQARRFLRTAAPDLVVTYNWGSIEVAMASRWRQRSALMHIQDGFGADEAEGELARRQRVRRFVYRRADMVVVPSVQLFDIARTDWRIAPDRLYQITNGVDCARFRRRDGWPDRTALGLPETARLIGTVAALRPEKDIGRMIEAFRHVVDVHTDIGLVIVGGGIGERALKILAERIGLKNRVFFTGPQETPEHFLAHLSMFLMSSDTEQLPLALLEAMAMRLPVVSTDVGDIRRTVAEINRPYIAGCDAETLAKHILDLLSKPDLAASIGARNRQRVESQYDLSVMVDQYRAAFQRALSR